MMRVLIRRSLILRICVLSFRTHEDRMAMTLEDIRAAAAEAIVERL